MPKIRVFSSDNIELAPCNLDRAHSLVDKDKAYFALINNDELVLVIKKSSEEAVEQEDNKA